MGIPQADIESELRASAFAAAWPDSMTVEIARLAKRVAYSRGSLIFREGERNDEIYLVLSGRVALEMSVAARGRVRLLTLSEGELLGWSPLVGNCEMTASAFALDETHLIAISSAALLALCDRDHEIGFAVMRWLAWALSRRLTATRLQLLDLYSHSAPDIAETAVTGGPA